MSSFAALPKFGYSSAPWIDLRSVPNPHNKNSALVRSFLPPNSKATIYADDWTILQLTMDSRGEPWVRLERTHPNIVCSVPLVLNRKKDLCVILIEQSRPNSNGENTIDFPGGLIGDKKTADKSEHLDLVTAAQDEFSEETGIGKHALSGTQVYSHVFPTIGATNEQTHYVVLYADYNKLPEELRVKGEMKGKGDEKEGEVISKVYLVPLKEFAYWFEQKEKEEKLFGASIFAAMGQLMLMANPHQDYKVASKLIPSPQFGRLSLMA